MTMKTVPNWLKLFMLPVLLVLVVVIGVFALGAMLVLAGVAILYYGIFGKRRVAQNVQEEALYEPPADNSQPTIIEGEFKHIEEKDTTEKDPPR